MSEQVTGVFNELEAQHLDGEGKQLALGEVMRHLQKLSADHPGDASRPERMPFSPGFERLAERQQHVEEILRPTERQVEIVRQVTAACALATPNAHFLDAQLGTLADSMRDEVIGADGKSKISLDIHREILTNERRRLAELYTKLILENNLLFPDLPVTINGNPDKWHSTIGRVDLAIMLERLLNTDPSHPDYPKIAQMCFALQQGVEDTTVARVFSPLNSRGNTLDELNERSGLAKLPNEWGVHPFNTVAGDEFPWNPDTHSYEPAPLSRFRRVVLIPDALGYDSGPIGIPKTPTVSGKMRIPS